MSFSKQSKVLYLRTQFEAALETLKKAVFEPIPNEYLQDAVIQRFEYTYEIAWKYIKAYLSYKGVELLYPKDMFKEAFNVGWIAKPEVWEAMIEDRNMTSHTYRSRSANRVYQDICKLYFSAFAELAIHLGEVIDRELPSAPTS